MRQAARLIDLPDDVGPTSPALLEAKNLEKWYGPYPAVRGISFSLHAGEFVTLFGPNGAGKTTLLRMLAGSLKPTRGELVFAVAGEDDDQTWRRRIGVLSHQTYLYGHLSAEENLRFYGRLYRISNLQDRIDSLLEEVGLRERARDRVRTFSRGMQQRVALARTLLHSPELVLLDEPYTGLDPHAAAMLRRVLERLKDGRRTVFLITHNISQGLELADRVVVQADGRWVSDEPRSGIEASGFERTYSERVRGAV